ncbi:MAG TPA: 2-oxoglutarate dehydrogenase E1 component, partial [Arenibaculum sp.]|nr:2-oxoglutarate dehydrogenase E1 component [Arenibaculum sp.]
HVNGDDPEAVVHAARVAIEFRQRFHKDVVIDMVCYRRFGHNEGDEPMFTQPLMYTAIKSHKTTLQLYTERLIADGLNPEGEIEDMKTAFQAHLNSEFEAGKEFRPNKADWLDGRWSGLGKNEGRYQRGKTGVELSRLKRIGEALTRMPETFRPHRTVQRMLEAKRQMIETGEGIDWATGEALAFGTLCAEGTPVRLSGQDVGRGTFSQRHSVLVDQETEARYVPLSRIREGQAAFEVHDSPLSEAAVLGFEYGITLAEPHMLTIWEAQFGDFTNGAQVIIDQFISSGEAKWLRMSGLVMLLPHGYEGQGPEHSSARPERFLQLCAEDNMQVCNLTTPANYFHALRRQVRRNFRKPLVVMTPKSLLRHKLCVSRLEDFGPDTSFHRVLPETAALAPDDRIRRIVLCSGKVYYDLLQERDGRGIDDVAIVRVEQLYPFPRSSLVRQFGRYANADVVWCQEEPANMGYWTFVDRRIESCMAEAGMKVSRPKYAGRPEAAAPATGMLKRHNREQAQLVDEALTVG